MLRHGPTAVIAAIDVRVTPQAQILGVDMWWR
jgi:hypothetical protein